MSDVRVEEPVAAERAERQRPVGALEAQRSEQSGTATVTDLGMPRMGFFTDTSVCIGCKACEVACKEWNAIPSGPLELKGESFDNTSALGADNWRHVAFVEQRVPADRVAATGATDLLGALDGSAPDAATDGTDGAGAAVGGTAPGVADGGMRWLMASDVCKHCTHAACLDVCPTGALVRTEFGTVVVQQDVCNGCGYCVSACPYGVLGQREGDGRVFKCTMCYDRMGQGQEPACAKACPTNSIQFGNLDELRERADQRLASLHDAGVTDARLYGADPDDGVGGNGAFFLLLDEPEVYGLPPDPVVTTRDLPPMWRHAAAAAAVLLSGLAATFVGRRRP